VRIVFYDNNTRESGTIVADTAYQYTGTKVIKLFKNVVVSNTKGDTFKSDELIWDMINHKIYSNKPVDMLMANGNTGHGTSMETNEKFNPLTVKNQTGIIYVSDDMTRQ
jgi:LPS export ABC transporter protein LptC